MKDTPDILASMAGTGRILAGLLAAIPAGAMHRRRGDGFWTIAEHADHLAQVQPMLLERIRRFLAEDHPVFVPYIPSENESSEAPASLAPDEAVDVFSRWRDEQVTLLRSAGPADWAKSADHPEYTHYSLPILARHILMHDHWHMYRMEELWLTRDEFLTRLEG